ncbi:hypothetical protein N0V93_008590 [Gnomoniopsis smithogilvyi]|uniref:Signal recognition particle subunit SRP14 n=1 Tax=Gnomoniopsis smithogilvyi TaxID=1191159 RepID=A0A9W8YQK4_9PEZI|nr:hypothetical protein N0V93_008590 [Gnomoniopsis smithogilvyi]
MPNSHLTHDEFFNSLGELFTSQKGKDHGSVFLTQKRLTSSTGASTPSRNEPLADIADVLSNDDSPSATYPVIIRATDGKGREPRTDGKGYQVRKDGKKVKLSTVVESDAIDAFYARYAEICKAGMMALKPRDRTKNKRKTKGKKKKITTA